MAMLRNKYSQLLGAGIKKIFVEFRDTQIKQGYVDKIFNIETSDKAYEDEMLFGSIGAMPEKTENDGFQYTELTPGGSKRFVHLTYGLGARYSWELAQDDQYGIIKTVPKALVRAGLFSREQVPANVLNQGFALIKTADGETLFNNAHPLLGGAAATALGPGVSNLVSAVGTYPNRPAVDTDLSYTSVQQMLTHFDRLTDSAGMPIGIKPKHVWIPAELRFIAKEIFETEGKPDTADNNLNVLKSEGLDWNVNPYFTSPHSWFVLADKSEHSLKMYNRHPLDQDDDDDFDTRSYKHVAFQRFSAGAVNWLGTWASQ